MREYKIVPGGRRWHGDELVKLQSETLDVLQDFIEPAGPCVIKGCTVSGSPGNYTIAPGLVGIPHATDGYKVVRFDGASGVSLPRWLRVTKTVANKAYDDGNNKLAHHEYKAEHLASQPSDPYLKIDPTGGRVWQQAYKTEWTSIVATIGDIGNISCNLKYRKCKFTNTVHIRGWAKANNAQNLTGNPTGVVLFQLPPDMRPNENVWYTAHIAVGMAGGIWFKDMYGLTYLTNCNGLVAYTGNVSIGMPKPESTVTQYTVYFHIIFSADQ